MKYNLIIGSFVQMNKANQYLLGSFQQMREAGGDALMIYTGAPHSTKRADLSNLHIEAFQQKMKAASVPLRNCVVHLPYLINLGNTIKPSTYHFGVNLLKSEIARSIAIGAQIIVLHPGSAVGADKTKSINQIIKGINSVLHKDLNIKIALEIMAGKGSQIGSTFEELQAIIEGVNFPEKIGICLDTCHTYDAGYDIKHNLDDVLSTIDQTIGINKIFVMHINDSKKPFASKSDRHENFGYGTIGFDALIKIVYHPKLNNIIKILETPFINGVPPYKHEIAMIKNKKFQEIKII